MMSVPTFSIADTVRVARALATNQLARIAPAAYVRLTGQTGRGAASEESPNDIAGYFRDCTDAYFAKLGVAKSDTASFLAGKTLMEYGPGDLPGVAALMIAHGAEKVYCIDRFPLVNLSEKNARVLDQLVDSCSGVERERLLSCLSDAANPEAGFDPRRIEYVVRPGGLSGLHEAVDLVFSRAVLEHVNDLDATFADMTAALRPGAAAIHLVDLRSHGLHKANPLDFLAWSPGLWNLMYSEKGVPNRWRIDRYRAAIDTLPIDLQALEPTKLASAEQVAEVRPMLASRFRDVSDEDLRWLGFWLVFRKQGA
jgi:SAM-dependent methyltransferase